MEQRNEAKFENTMNFTMIYVFRITDGKHDNILKIGDTTIKTKLGKEKLISNSEVLIESAKNRINEYTRTAGIKYELLWTELAVDNENKAFRDHSVHRVLKNSNIKRKELGTNANEWFEVDLETVKNAINAVKEGKSSLLQTEITQSKNPIIFRPEQIEAIERTTKKFKKSNRMLWNAKMRFGKTLTALQVIKEMKFERTIILTHRPVVEDGWFQDFNNIFYDTKNIKVGSKAKSNIKELENSGCNYVYFASIQDLRGSSKVGGNFEKNEEIFDIKWDFVIIDEAHEGTKTTLGDNVLNEIIKEDTKVLQLSGTPFNLLDDFKEDEIYTWDYVMEQSAKRDWTQNHYLDSNPYDELPRLNIYTYYLNKILPSYAEVEDAAFNFREFFRVWTGNSEVDRAVMPNDKKVGNFKYEEDVVKFLNLIVKENESSNYPYSTKEYRDYFRHSLWIVPGVKEAKALSALMKKNEVFANFEIVNVAGNGDDNEEENYEALGMVNKAIGEKPENTYTITISCGRLTTGVSVPAWSAVLMLSGSSSTSASSYLQTIFRVQTPANINGRIKEECYVFDFSPDRTLKMVAEAVSLNTRAGVTDSTGKKQMGEFLNFCPIVAIDDSQMKSYDVDMMLQQLKRAYADRVMKNGFDDVKIYNDELLQLDGIELEKFEKLKAIIGKTKQTKSINNLDINIQGFSKEEYDEIKKNEMTKHKDISEDKEALKRKQEVKKNKEAAISIIRGISIRIPLMIYGAEIPKDKEITPENFSEIIDDKSWDEFMPKGVTKELYKEISKYYDKEIFIEAGKKIRNRVIEADKLPVTERVIQISKIISMFKNPDKETILTPWRTVNMHLGSTIGGYSFFREIDNNIEIEEPMWIEPPMTNLFSEDKQILEINSKTGVYPLYVAYSYYRKMLENKEKYKDIDIANYWGEVLKNNIFVVCKTKMAKNITKRTLAGYNNDYSINIIDYEDIINELCERNNVVSEKILSGNTWDRSEKNMKFDCVVGNPPYQEDGAGGGSADKSVYNYYIDLSQQVAPIVSMIHPARFLFNAGSTPESWNKRMLNDKDLEVVLFEKESGEIFPNTDIKGGISITYWQKGRNNGGQEGLFIPNEDLKKIVKKIGKGGFEEIIYPHTHVNRTINPDDPKRRELKSNWFQKFPQIFKETKGKSDVRIIAYSIEERQRIWRYCSKNILKDNLIEHYKVFVAGSNGSGKMGECLSEPFIGKPNEGCSQSFIQIGKFENEVEAQNCLKYIKTKFCRVMLGVLKATQANTKNTWKKIPMQNFTSKSDINWEKSIKEIDKQLYSKYNFSDEEISYIEKIAKEMI